MRRTLSIATLSTALVAGAVSTAAAIDKSEGIVRERPCPYSCQTAQIPKSHCRDWREGDSCFVQDLRAGGQQRAGGQSAGQARGSEQITRYYDLSDADQQRIGEDTVAFRVRERLESGSAVRLDVPDRPIEEVEVRLRRESGSRDTYVKLGFDRDLRSVAGREQQVDQEDLHTVSWNVDERRPRELVLAAFNGEVYVDAIRVQFSDQDRSRARMRDDDYEWERRNDYERGRRGEDGWWDYFGMDRRE